MDKSPFRVSTWQMMIAIALIGLVMSAVRYAIWPVFFAGTVYSAEYDEGRFRQIHMGMTAEEVEALVGPPLRKVPRAQEGYAKWIYTESRPRYPSYRKRDVFMKDDKVINVVRTYYVD